jgi:hypothetical protein
MRIDALNHINANRRCLPHAAKATHFKSKSRGQCRGSRQDGYASRAAPDVTGENKKMAWLAVTAGLKLEGCVHEGV